MVVSTFSRMKRDVNSDARASQYHRNQCISSGLGSMLYGYSDQRTLEMLDEKRIYQLTGAGRSISSNNIWESKAEHAYSSPNGQHNSHINKTDGGGGRGGTHSYTLERSACNLWQWCLGRGIIGTSARITECDSVHGSNPAPSTYRHLISISWASVEWTVKPLEISMQCLLLYHSTTLAMS